MAKVEEESRRFSGLNSEAEQIRVFMETDSAAYFIWCVCVCWSYNVPHLLSSVLWKGLMERGTVNPALIKVAQRTQPKKLAAFTRKLIDYIMFSSQPTTPQHITKVTHITNNYNTSVVLCVGDLSPLGAGLAAQLVHC